MKSLLKVIMILFLATACNLETKEDPPPIEPERVVRLTSDLFSAIDEQNVSEVSRFVSEGADLKAYDAMGKTPLMRAVQVGNARIVEILIVNGSLIFQPEKENNEKTAYKLAMSEQGPVFEYFKDEYSRVLGIFESRLTDTQYGEALSFFKENYIPLDIRLPKDTRRPLYFVAQTDKSYSAEAKDIVRYFIENSDNSWFGEELTGLSAVLQYSSRSRDLEYYEMALKRFKFMDGFEIEYNRNFYIGHFYLDNQFNLDWTHKKLSLFSKLEIKPQTTAVNFALTLFADSIATMSRADLEKLVSVFDLYFSMVISDETTETRYIHDELIDKIEKSFSSYRDGLYVITELIKIVRVKYQISGSFFYGDLVAEVIKADIKYNYNISHIKEFIDLRVSLASDSKLHSDGALQALITDYVHGTKRTDLISYLLERIAKAPENILSLALERDKEVFRMILSSGIEIDPENERNAALSAIQYSRTGEEARVFLHELKEAGIILGENHFRDALMTSFSKLWEGESSFEVVVELLMEDGDALKALYHDTKIEILKKHALFVRKTRLSWSLLRKIIPMFSNVYEELRKGVYSDEIADRNNQLVYETELSIDAKDVSVNISALMDIIVSVFEIYSNGIAQIAPCRSIIAKAFEVFDKTQTSMDYSDQKLSYKHFTIHQVFPLSYLFSRDGESILNRTPYLNEQVHFGMSRRANSPLVDWNNFVTSDLYLHYSRQKDFWSAVVEEYLSSGRSEFSTIGKNTYKFMKIFIDSGGLESHSRVANFSYTFPVEEAINNYCVHDKGVFGTQIAVPLGNFEVLLPFYDKSCHKKAKLSDSEKTFLFSYVRNNLGEVMSSSGVENYRVHRNTNLVSDYYKSFTDGYAPPHTKFGGSTKYEDEHNLPEALDASILMPEALVAGNEVTYVVPSARQSYHVRLRFLRALHMCARESGDIGVVQFIESLKGTHTNIIEAFDDVGRVTMCRVER